jgi:PAS domain S-box-containing protein
VPEGIYEYVSPPFLRILGYTPEELHSTPQSLHESIHPDCRESFDNQWKKLLDGKVNPSFEYRIIQKSGDTRWVRQKSVIVHDENNGKPVAVEGIITDITDRKRSEESQPDYSNRLHHLNRVIFAIRNINKLITTEKDVSRLLSRACDLLVETRGYYNAWIGLSQDLGLSETCYFSGFNGEFSSMADKLCRGDLPNCAGETLKSNGIFVIDNPLEQCPDCPLVENYRGRAGFSIRLEHKNRVYGWLSVSVPKVFSRDLEEQNLFVELSNDIAFALWSIEMEAQSQANEQKYAAVKRRRWMLLLYQI